MNEQDMIDIMEARRWGAGEEQERERIKSIIKGEPTALEFYEPYIGVETLLKKIDGEKE